MFQDQRSLPVIIFLIMPGMQLMIIYFARGTKIIWSDEKYLKWLNIMFVHALLNLIWFLQAIYIY